MRNGRGFVQNCIMLRYFLAKDGVKGLFLMGMRFA